MTIMKIGGSGSGGAKETFPGKGSPMPAPPPKPGKAPLDQSLQRLKEKENLSLQRLKEKENLSLQRLRAKANQRLQIREEKEKESLERLMKAPGEELLGTQGEEPTKGLIPWAA